MTLYKHWMALMHTHRSCFCVVNLLEKRLHYRTEWNAFELTTFAAHVKMHLAFKALHQESCCAAYCNISRTLFQILVGGRDTYQQRFVLLLALMSVVTCTENAEGGIAGNLNKAKTAGASPK